MFPFAPGFAGVPRPPSARIEVPFSVRGMPLTARVERHGSRIYASLSIPTRWGLVELCVGVEEAPIRAALQRAINGELGRQAAAFFQMGQPAALAQLAALPPPDPAQLQEGVLALASDVAFPDLMRQAFAALDGGPGAGMFPRILPGPANMGDYAATFEGRGYGYGLPPPRVGCPY